MPSVNQQIDGWIVTMTWPEGALYGGPTSLSISHGREMPLGGLSSTILRQINFRAALSELRSGLPKEASDADLLQKASDARQEGVTDLYLALLANLYLSRVQSAVDKPVDGIAEELGMSLATAKNHLWQAGKRGLLDGSPGRKGGKLTDKARDLVTGV